MENTTSLKATGVDTGGGGGRGGGGGGRSRWRGRGKEGRGGRRGDYQLPGNQCLAEEHSEEPQEQQGAARGAALTDVDRRWADEDTDENSREDRVGAGG